MPDAFTPKLPKWPFVSGDILLLGAALLIHMQSAPPLGPAHWALIVFCVASGAALSIFPYVLEYRAAGKIAEAAGLTTVVSQLKALEQVSAQIAGATGRWANVQEEAEKVAGTARSITDRMTAELKAFSEFMQKANDSEKSNLRLEVEKLRRVENEWLQVLVRILDHVHALHLGAVKSGSPNLIEQLTHFQNACRDAARRVGMVPFVAAPAEVFDPKRHQVHEGQGTPPEGATVASTLAAGYTFQGRLLRPAIVALNPSGTPQEAGAPPPPKLAQSQML